MDTTSDSFHASSQDFSAGRMIVLSDDRCDELALERIGPRVNESLLGDSSMVSIETRLHPERVDPGVGPLLFYRGFSSQLPAEETDDRLAA